MAADLQLNNARRHDVRQTTTAIAQAPRRVSGALEPTVCDPCEGDPVDLVLGNNPDGVVICRKIRSPLFYYDAGGQN